MGRNAAIVVSSDDNSSAEGSGTDEFYDEDEYAASSSKRPVKPRSIRITRCNNANNGVAIEPVEASSVHAVPFSIKYSGPANVSHFFRVVRHADGKPPGRPETNLSETSHTKETRNEEDSVEEHWTTREIKRRRTGWGTTGAGVMVDEENVLRSSFRGRLLMGREIHVPDGYTAVILHESMEAQEDQDSDRIFTPTRYFKRFSYWRGETAPGSGPAALAVCEINRTTKTQFLFRLQEKIMQWMKWPSLAEKLHYEVWRDSVASSSPASPSLNDDRVAGIEHAETTQLSPMVDLGSPRNRVRAEKPAKEEEEKMDKNEIADDEDTEDSCKSSLEQSNNTTAKRAKRPRDGNDKCKDPTTTLSTTSSATTTTARGRRRLNFGNC